MKTLDKHDKSYGRRKSDLLGGLGPREQHGIEFLGFTLCLIYISDLVLEKPLPGNITGFAQGNPQAHMVSHRSLTNA